MWCSYVRGTKVAEPAKWEGNRRPCSGACIHSLHTFPRSWEEFNASLRAVWESTVLQKATVSVPLRLLALLTMESNLQEIVKQSESRRPRLMYTVCMYFL